MLNPSATIDASHTLKPNPRNAAVGQSTWKQYRDFVIRIEPGDTPGAYRVEAQGAASEARCSFAVPFEALAIENFLLRVGRPRSANHRGRVPQPMQHTVDFGGRLFEALIHGEVRDIFIRERQDAENNDQGLRIQLRLNATPELTDLPWEFLYDGRDFLALSDVTPLVRYLELPAPPRPLKVDLPLRVLVTISAPDDLPPLDVSEEAQKVEQALGALIERGLVQVEYSEAAHLNILQKQLRSAKAQGRPYHVWHFIGHGAFDSASRASVLAFTDEHVKSQLIGGFQLGTLFKSYPEVRLVFLNACEGARTDREDPFAGVAAALVERGCPAVVAMQFEITDTAAIRLAGEFYSALVDGLPVDAALSEARRAVFFIPNWVEWATPVLFMRVRDGRLFDVDQERARQEAERQEQARQQAAAAEAARQEKERQQVAAAEAARVEKERQQAAERERQRAEAEARARHEREQREQTEAWLQQARDQLAGGDWQSAAQSWQSAEAILPDTPGIQEVAEAIEAARLEEESRQRRQPFEPEMVLIPAGPFLMGSPKSDKLRFDDEPEQFQLDLNYDYAIGRYPVTVGQYRAFIEAGGYRENRWWTAAGLKQRQNDKWTQPRYWDDAQWSGQDDLPVVGVSWYEAQAYTRWLAEATGREYRLLTEAEWEKAARGGLMIPDGQGGMKKNPAPARIWPWGDEEPTKDLCNYAGNVGRTSPVTSHAAQAQRQPYGLYHMAGNVWEWCLSAWANPYAHPEQNNPEGEVSRVLRGGSWYDFYVPRSVRCSYRFYNLPFYWDGDVGFRVGGLVPAVP